MKFSLLPERVDFSLCLKLLCEASIESLADLQRAVRGGDAADSDGHLACNLRHQTTEEKQELTGFCHNKSISSL
eukprot:759451-Hanusia_phi.AAC.4